MNYVDGPFSVNYAQDDKEAFYNFSVFEKPIIFPM